MINSNWYLISYRFGVIAAYCSNFGHCVFEPSLRSLGTTYDAHLGFIGKRVVDFLLVLIELFSLGVTSEALAANIGWKSAVAGWPKISGRRGRPHQPFFFSGNWAKWSIVSYKNRDRSFFRFVTIHAFDRQTDGRTDRQTDIILIAIPLLHCTQRGKKAKHIARYITPRLRYQIRYIGRLLQLTLTVRGPALLYGITLG